MECLLEASIAQTWAGLSAVRWLDAAGSQLVALRRYDGRLSGSQQVEAKDVSGRDAFLFPGSGRAKAAPVRALQSDEKGSFFRYLQNVRVDATKLRTALLPSPDNCLERISETLPEIAATKNEALLNELTAAHAFVTHVPFSVSEFVELLVFLETFGNSVQTRDEEYDIISASQAARRTREQVLARELHTAKRRIDMEVVAELPMVLSSRKGDGMEFELEFQPPGPEQYHLSLRLYDADGRAYQSAASMRAIGLRLSAQRPVLVFVHDSIKPELREPLLTDLNEVLQAHSLEADIVTRAPVDKILYASLLDHYRDQGDLVVWIGQTLDAEAQSVFQRFEIALK